MGAQPLGGLRVEDGALLDRPAILLRRPSRDVLLSGELRDEAWARRRPV
ncbi:hypothetical protein ABZ178_17200 [Streptomyces massasporeus]